jgi:hypothetical protein
MVRPPFLQHLARTGADHMVSFKQVLVVSAVLAVAGVVTPAFAQEQEVTVTASRLACEGMSANDSSRLAREAEKKGSYQEASDCFIAAGEYNRAHRASARAAGEAASVAKRNASTAASSAKSQFARMKAAFR